MAKREISMSCREDHREHVSGILNDMDAAERCGNSREVSRLTRLLSGKRHACSINPSKDPNDDLLVTQDQLLGELSKFLGAKFASPDADKSRSLGCVTSEEDELGDEELRMCLEALRCGKAPGCDNVPVEAYRGSVEATKELLRISRLMWHTERIPSELVRGMFVMLHKKGSRDDYRNYRAICLLCHLMSAIVARRLMILREGRLAVISFIDYSAAFDTESQMFLDIKGPRRGKSRCSCAPHRAGHLCGSHRSSAPQTSRWHDDTLRAIRLRQRCTPGGHLLAHCIYRRTVPDLPDA